ncbi:hypothetical protein Nepgr_028000 [Nepenthes gracilis]|uniref:Uncharacterized protein n=1 Tax=Nepenthes gracilis TaxID=150966 RepID=A0AAD3Y1Q7_NEPGR|nr:hypothetical protein Nepgr_028000 [Nepenthes gracilis]
MLVPNDADGMKDNLDICSMIPNIPSIRSSTILCACNPSNVATNSAEYSHSYQSFLAKIVVGGAIQMKFSRKDKLQQRGKEIGLTLLVKKGREAHQ